MRSYSLYLTAAIALGRIGKSLVPLLEKEIEKQPLAVLQILENLIADGTLPIFFRAMQHKDAKVRQKAIKSLPRLTSTGAIEALPHLLAAMNDENADVRETAMSEIGTIAEYTADKSDELKQMLAKRAIPALIDKLKVKETSCSAALTLGDFGADGEAAIPALANLIKKNDGDYCAETALFEIGEKGKKFLSKEQIERIEESNKSDREIFNRTNKVKPIKPKTQASPSPLKKEG